MKGIFITFEGIEGSGKSTVAGSIGERFREAGYRTLMTREPGGTVVSEKIREILLDPEIGDMHARAELLLYLASRAQLVEEVIRPGLDQGMVVLCDRFFDATTAYQGWARGLGEDTANQLNSFAVQGVIPDLTLLLDLPVEKGFSRGPRRREETGQARRDRLELESGAFHSKVREGYLRIAEREKRVVIIDASRTLEEVELEIIGNINTRLGVQL
ncbi:MAG: dTMP kinase [Candidatus Krumholzibacteriales bacterium]